MNSDLREEKIRELVTARAQSLDALILAGLPVNYDIRKITRCRYVGSSFEIWSYDGEPFLELHDPVFTNSFDEAGNAKITMTINHRYLRNSENGQNATLVGR